VDERNRNGVAIQANPGTGAHVETIPDWERAFSVEGRKRTVFTPRNMNMNNWKYRYRRFRCLSLDDLTRRLEIRSWRKGLVKFVNNESNPITYQNIREWINFRIPSIEAANHDPKKINQNMANAIPKGFLTDLEFWKTFAELYPREKDRLIELAFGVIEGRIELFGWKSVSVSIPSLKLHDETALNKDWSSSYYWDINFFHSTECPGSDVKWLWELQRFQFLLWLGAAWKLTGDKKFASTAREILNSWMQDLKYPFGVEWSSNLEVGLRLLSISRCHIMCMNATSWDTGFLSNLVAWEYLHAIHIKNELTLHHTLGNHPLGESAALLFFCLVNPGSAQSVAWEKFSFKTINQLIPRLINQDGVYAEQSTSYLKFVCEFMLPLIYLGKSKEGKFTSLTLDRIKSCLKFVQSISDAGKSTPMIGDADSGCAIGWRLSDYWDFSWLLAAGASLLNEPGLARGIDDFPVEAFLNTGLEGLAKFRSFSTRSRLRSGANSTTHFSSVDFPFGGYHVSTDSHFKLIFDSGPLGIYPGFGHGHADALSIIINVNNMPFLVDSGTMRYNGASDVRNYFRGTSAHNTLTIGGHSQAKVLDTFKWASGYKIHWFEPIIRSEYRIFSAVLYVKSFNHQRTIVHFPDKGFLIRDIVCAGGDFLVEEHLHFSPDTEIKPLGSNKFVASLENEFLDVEFPGSPSGCAQIVHGSSNQMLGWYSRHYGQQDASACLKFSCNAKGRIDFMTVIRLPGNFLRWTDDMISLLFLI